MRGREEIISIKVGGCRAAGGLWPRAGIAGSPGHVLRHYRVQRNRFREFGTAVLSVGLDLHDEAGHQGKWLFAGAQCR